VWRGVFESTSLQRRVTREPRPVVGALRCSRAVIPFMNEPRLAVRGGAPVSPNRSRKSIVTHHCPREVAPALFRIYAAP
jgi:hypothetical protein